MQNKAIGNGYDPGGYPPAQGLPISLENQQLHKTSKERKCYPQKLLNIVRQKGGGSKICHDLIPM
jgi:hypothetical protein